MLPSHNIPDAYYKKRIAYTCKGHTFAFDVAHTLFSSHEIDKGSDLFLRTIELASPARILDLGCGCGVLGVVLAHLFPSAHVTLIDKDLLAVRYAQYNTMLNQTPNTQIIGSVGLEHASVGQYDVIVSNIPAKIGENAIEQEFILAPFERLTPEGVYWFVVVSGLNHLIPRIGTRHHLDLKSVKKRSGHTIYRLQR